MALGPGPAKHQLVSAPDGGGLDIYTGSPAPGRRHQAGDHRLRACGSLPHRRGGTSALHAHPSQPRGPAGQPSAPEERMYRSWKVAWAAGETRYAIRRAEAMAEAFPGGWRPAPGTESSAKLDSRAATRREIWKPRWFTQHCGVPEFRPASAVVNTKTRFRPCVRPFLRFRVQAVPGQGLPHRWVRC